MAKPGRRSAAHLTVISPDATNIRPPLIPLQPLKPAELKIFSFMARENEHLRPSDAVLLAAFARAATGLQSVDTAQDFERLARVCTHIATKLRICPQSRCHPKTLARRIADEYVGPRPWDRIPSGEDDNDDDQGLMVDQQISDNADT